MATQSFCVLAVCLQLALCLGANLYFTPPKSNANQCEYNIPPCGVCRGPIDVTLIARNKLEPPFFQKVVNISKYPTQTLIRFLEKGSDVNQYFNFSASYHSNLGYMINTLNGKTADPARRTYWEILDVQNGSALRCGVSSYVPRNNEIVMFNFTKW